MHFQKQGLKGLISTSILSLLIGAGLSYSQDMDVQGDGSNSGIILQGKNINPTNSDKVGVQGYSVPNGYYGYGVRAYGGWKGVQGQATTSANQGNGTRYGIKGTATNGSSNYGVHGWAYGSTGTNYGVYGSASGTNSRAGKFSGDLEYTGSLIGPSSDLKLKKNISEIRNCMQIVSRLEPKEFEYRTEEFPALNLSEGRRMGLIAQDVERVLPELVHESQMSAEEEDEEKKKKSAPGNEKEPEIYKTVDYVSLVPVLIGALQEQAWEIELLKKRLGGVK